MDEKIREHLKAYNKAHDCSEDEDTLIETVTEAKQVYRETTDNRRWWDELLVVVEIDGMLIGYDWARATGDMSARERGWEFDPDSICEVEAVQVTKTVYRKK